ncbi:XdhC/CoxI family protein [Alicyclobacillaceae bacterium I2511]|nr:XdhC/CoxI family protein [Alicyclobacillaceae bacterium I2511]
MNELYETCAQVLSSGEDVVLATIMSKKGSAPRTAGTKMLVRRDGSIVGTIGGGLLEAHVLNLARVGFQTGQSAVQEFQLTGNDVAGTDMICGGRVEVFVDFLSANVPHNVEFFQSAASLQRSGQQALLATELPGQAGDGARLERGLLFKDGRQVGSSLPAVWRDPLLQSVRGGHPQQVTVGGTRYLLEAVHTLRTVYLFGAGHVSQQVAKLTSMVDFRTVVLDDREEFANRGRFPEADEILVADGFEHCVKDLPISADSYLVIVTRAHQHDLTVLAQALQTSASYIGLISSSRKRRLIYEALRESGVTEAQLARVYSPIGLPITAETPEEIAVSIVAELIKVRGEQRVG